MYETFNFCNRRGRSFYPVGGLRRNHGIGHSGRSCRQQCASNEGVTCKTVIKTGTRLGTRVCKKDEVWAREAGDSRDAINDIQRNSAQSAGPSGG